MIKINSSLFDWVSWRNGTPLDVFDCQLRSYTLKLIKPQFHRFAVGYCDGENLPCRPKIEYKAVMFLKNGTYYWFHFTNEEFELLND
jgi:hypothetical protein